MPIVLINRNDIYLSDVDNRYLLKKSDIRDLNTLGDYIDDRIGGREMMIEIYHKINEVVFDNYDHDEVYLGLNEYTFPKIKNNVEYSKYHEDFANFVIDMSNYYVEQDIEFYFVFNPSKSSIYPELLPHGVNYNSDWVDVLLNDLMSNNVKVVDNYNYFKKIKTQVDLFNTKYDPAHWNDIGALYGTNHLLSIMGNDYPSIKNNSLQDYTIQCEKMNYLPNTKIRIDEEVVFLESQTTYQDLTSNYIDKIELMEDFNYFHYYKTNDITKPRVLMFQGSYYNSSNRSKFITNNTSEYIAIHNYRNVEKYDYYSNIFNPDCVIFEVAEYTLEEYFFSQWAMQNKETIKTFNTTKEIIKKDNESLEITINYNDSYVEYFVSGLPNNAENCYVINGDKAYNMSRQEENKWYCMFDQRIFDNKKVEIVYELNDTYYGMEI